MKQEIFYLPCQLSAVPCCVDGVGKGFWGQKGLTSARLPWHLGQPLAPHGDARGFQPRLSEVKDVTASCSSVPQFPPAVEQR